jgi:hypothetical protein
MNGTLLRAQDPPDSHPNGPAPKAPRSQQFRSDLEHRPSTDLLLASSDSNVIDLQNPCQFNHQEAAGAGLEMSRTLQSAAAAADLDESDGHRADERGDLVKTTASAILVVATGHRLSSTKAVTENLAVLGTSLMRWRMAPSSAITGRDSATLACTRFCPLPGISRLTRSSGRHASVAITTISRSL